MKHKKRRLPALILFTVALLLIGAILINLYISYHALGVTDYHISSEKISEEISIVMLADLHDSTFGKDNSKLIKAIEECDPDLILTVGDMISKYTEDYSYLEPLYKSLSDIAPTYCSLGNHELNNANIEDIKVLLDKSCDGLLDNEYIEINVNGNLIRLGGIMNYHPDNEEANVFVDEYTDTDTFTLLMSHCPEYYTWGIDERKVDVMLSGHTHGGQIILPFIGGLYAPEQLFFPELDYGVFYEENATLVITRGLGSSRQPVPRFNNPPEVIHLTLLPESINE